jgi:cystathionine gamma-lyase
MKLISKPIESQLISVGSTALGAVPSPFDCFLANRGLKTLSLRMERHEKNALQVAAYLESHDKVDRVLYPGLKSHPQHELAKEQCSGFSGMVSLYLKGGESEMRSFITSLRVFTLAESLGAVESLAEIPSLMTHASHPPEVLAKLGITDSLVRLSVGIEDAQDLINDLEQALAKVQL